MKISAFGSLLFIANRSKTYYYYRMTEMEKYQHIYNQMVKATEDYLNKFGLKTMVLGISGGLDSTVTASICHEVSRRNPGINFIGVSLPCSSNSESENNSALACMKAFCDECWVENLQKEYMLFKATCELHTPSTPISQGNIKARLRMIYLYNLASTRGGLVMDTDNLTEHYLGFFTIHGDVADFNPIGSLWKHEVYELAQYLYDAEYTSEEDEQRRKALGAAIGIMPTDGNGVNNFGDMGQIAPAFVHDKNVDAYRKVDDVLLKCITAERQSLEECQEVVNNLYETYGKETVDGIIKRYKGSEFKRKRLPIVPELKD